MRFISLVLLTAALAVAEAFKSITLYDSYNKSGKSIQIYSSAPDLTRPGFNFNNKAMSVCGSGIWILYKYINYVTVPEVPESLGEVVMLLDGQCQNLQIAPGKVSSLRPLNGKCEYSVPSLNLFELAHFGGSMTTLTGNSSSLVGNQEASLIITGTARWAISINQNPYNICLIPAVEDVIQVVAIRNITSEPFGILRNSIQSIRTGCSGKELKTLMVIGENRPVDPPPVPTNSNSDSEHVNWLI